MSAPNPTRSARAITPESAGRRRQLGCRRVLECLTVASRAGWPGFSCTRCTIDDREALPINLGPRGIDASRAGT